MNREQIINEVTDIFKDVLDDDTILLEDSTSAKDIEEWDSLNHIQLIVAIEKHFNIRFKNAEINNWKNVGEMCMAIETKLS